MIEKHASIWKALVTIANLGQPPRLLYSSILILLAACSGDPKSGPVEVKWDRDVCQRCNMVLSDRFHAAQIRHTPPNEASQVRLFDDLGCALLWLDQQPGNAGAKVEIWVTDHRNGEWIEARSGQTFAVTNPATGDEIGRMPDGGADDARDAIAAADDAFRSWSRTTAYERAVADGEMVPGTVEERAELSTLLLLGCFVVIKGGAELEEIQRLTGRAVDLIESWRIAPATG